MVHCKVHFWSTWQLINTSAKTGRTKSESKKSRHSHMQRFILQRSSQLNLDERNTLQGKITTRITSCKTHSLIRNAATNFLSHVFVTKVVGNDVCSVRTAASRFVRLRSNAASKKTENNDKYW